MPQDERDDRNQENPVEMDADEWAKFYGSVEAQTGMEFEEFLDHDHGMDG